MSHDGRALTEKGDLHWALPDEVGANDLPQAAE
jgi:hypothetical protein